MHPPAHNPLTLPATLRPAVASLQVSDAALTSILPSGEPGPGGAQALLVATAGGELHRVEWEPSAPGGGSGELRSELMQAAHPQPARDLAFAPGCGGRG